MYEMEYYDVQHDASIFLRVPEELEPGLIPPPSIDLWKSATKKDWHFMYNGPVDEPVV